MARGIQAYYARNNPVALNIFRQAAAIGDVDAMMYLGVMYGTGRGVTADYQAARVVPQGGGRRKQPGHVQRWPSVPPGARPAENYSEAMSWFRKAATSGNAEAMFNVGVLYRDGLGVPVDYGEALNWFRKAAGAGDDIAANAIGVLYQQGLGVSVDYAEAMSWYRRAADAGNDTAMYNIGVLWEGGLGVARDRGRPSHGIARRPPPEIKPARAALKVSASMIEDVRAARPEQPHRRRMLPS